MSRLTCSRGVSDIMKRTYTELSSNHGEARLARGPELSNHLRKAVSGENVDSNPRRQGRVLQIFSSQRRCVSEGRTP